MSVGTCIVRDYVFRQDGQPDVGARVTARLSRWEVDPDEGYVGPYEVETTTDADGFFSVALFPQADGSTESVYVFRIEGAERPLSVKAVVPSIGTAWLRDVATLPPFPGKEDGAAAVTAAQQAVAAAAQAQAAANSVLGVELNLQHYVDAASGHATAASLSQAAASISESEAEQSESAAYTNWLDASAAADQAQAQASLALGHAADAADSAQLAQEAADSVVGDVLNVALTGLSAIDDTPLAASDTVLDAFGKLQGQIDGIGTGGDFEPEITAGTSGQYFRGDKSWQTLNKAAVGLGSVDNTADSAKPVSTPQAAAIATAASQLPVNSQTGSSYTLVLADAGKRVARSDSGANTTQVPTNASVAFPVSTILFVSQDGAGASSITAAGGVTVNTAEGLNLGGQHRMVALIKTATNTWLCIGTVA